MSEPKEKDQGDRSLLLPIDKALLSPPDAQRVRNAGAGEIKAMQALNKNAHNGSAGGDQDESMQIVSPKIGGGFSVIAERPQDKQIATEAGGERSLAAQIVEQENTSSIVAAEAKKNPCAEPVSLFLEHINKMVPGPEKETFRQLARAQAADISPEMKSKMERLDQVRQQIADPSLDEGGTHQALAPEMLKGKVEHSHVLPAEQPLTNTPDGWLTAGQKIAVLPPEMQAKIIATGLMAGIQQHRHDEHERHWGALIGSVQGAGNVAANLAKIADFSAYCIIGDHERAGEIGHEFGTALGQTTVSGLKLFGSMQKYSYDIGYTGDYAKPVKDVVAVGDLLNHQWSELSPREQERRKYQLITEMTADGLLAAGGAQAIGKAKKFTEVLDVIAEQAGRTAGRGIEASNKAVRAVENAVDDLMQPEIALPGGGKMKLRDLGENNAAMSASDDLGGGAKPKDVQSGKSDKPLEVTKEALDNPEGLAKLAKKFGISMPPKDTYVFAGEKDAVSAEAAARRLNLTVEQLKNLDEAFLAAQKLERVPDYRDAFFNRYPGLIPIADRLYVHHAVPKWVLKEHPGLFTAKEINDVLYLRGIYEGVNNTLHQRVIHGEWREFTKQYPNPSRREILAKVREIDKLYGHQFAPTEGDGL